MNTTESSESQDSREFDEISPVVPQFVKDWFKNVPEEVLCSVGAAKRENITTSTLVADSRAIDGIYSSVNSLVQAMIFDYYTGASSMSKYDTLLFFELLNKHMDSEIKPKIIIIEHDIGPDDNAVWSLAYLSKRDVVGLINKVQILMKN